jgi:hypothetical protein
MIKSSLIDGHASDSVYYYYLMIFANTVLASEPKWWAQSTNPPRDTTATTDAVHVTWPPLTLFLWHEDYVKLVTQWLWWLISSYKCLLRQSYECLLTQSSLFMKNALGYTFTNCYLEQLVLDECIRLHINLMFLNNMSCLCGIMDLNSWLSHLAFYVPKLAIG